LQWLENYAIAGGDVEQTQPEQQIFTSSESEGQRSITVGAGRAQLLT
jgi:hypothetical protein